MHYEVKLLRLASETAEMPEDIHKSLADMDSEDSGSEYSEHDANVDDMRSLLSTQIPGGGSRTILQKKRQVQQTDYHLRSNEEGGRQCVEWPEYLDQSLD